MKNLDASLHIALLSVLLSLMFGCGGNSATVASHMPPPPPAITVEVSTTGSGVVQAGGRQQFTATVANDPAHKGVAWTVSCSALPCGSVSPTSTASGEPTTYTAPGTVPSGDLTMTITATSVANSAVSCTVTVTVAAITASVTPASALLPVGSTQQFTATVGNDPKNQGVTWTLAQGGTACSPACGWLSLSTTASGSQTSYSAPTTMPTIPSATLTATSVTDRTKSATAAITFSRGTVQLVPGSLDFGQVLLNVRGYTKAVTLTNTGQAVLGITGITITGDNAGDFSQTNTCEPSVDAGMSCSITVTFKPSQKGPRSANISIADTSTDSPQLLSLTGTGKSMGGNMAAVRSALASVGTVTVPIPTGTETVGTRVLHLIDSTREDPYLDNGTKRELLVRFWYPAALAQACKRADYTSPKVWGYFSQLAGVHLPEVATNSCVDAPMTDGVHSVVVFTHGYTGTFTDYTFLFEDLASRGYVVASADHTYEATAVEFPDGRFVKSNLGSHLGKIWRGDDMTLAFATSVRLQDLKFVLNEMQRLNRRTDDLFEGKLDMLRIAVAGHSLGGTTAFLAVEQDARFRAAIILDGYVPRALIHPTQIPVLVLKAGQVNTSADVCPLWKSLRGPRLFMNLSGAEHLTPSDAVWLAKGAIETGSLGPEKTVAAMREDIATFLDTNLRKRSWEASMTTPPSDGGDPTVVTEEQSLCREP